MTEPNFRFKSMGKYWDLFFPNEEYAIKHAQLQNAECFFLFMDVEMPLRTKVEVSPGFISFKLHKIGE